MMPTTGRVIIIEGNISAGKSTLARELGNELGYKVFYEPTVTNPYLDKFYANPAKFALPMQLWFLRQRFDTYCAALEYASQHGGVILDRSLFSDIVFALKNRQDGNINEEGFDEYLALRAQFLQGVQAPHAVVYLDVSPQLCHDRVHNLRKRDCEAGIPLEYLEGLDRCYKDFLRQMSEEHQCAMICKEWANFGGAAQIAEEIMGVRATRIAVPKRISHQAHTHVASTFVLEQKDDDRAHTALSPMRG